MKPAGSRGMHIEIINTGSELLLGRVLNTHQQWICRQLADNGWSVARQVAVPDTAHDILAAVREALGRADLIITTGGLGPTSDDVTRDLVAQLLGRTLKEDPQVLQTIRACFASRQRPMPERAKVQALVPHGARVLPNAHGTAPGLAMLVEPNPVENGRRAWLVMLPGPPRELRPMFTEHVIPLLMAECPPDAPFVCVTLRSTGLGESVVEERVGQPLAALVRAGLELGYCARSGEVDIRLAARGPRRQELVASAVRVVREELHHQIYGIEDETLEAAVVRALTERGLTVAVAESCTGGLIAHRITNVPGASVVFMGGCTAYSDRVKQRFLNVPAEAIEAHGAVSETVARSMAEGARAKFDTDYALAVTGIAGPGGGTPAKPVGTVFIALAGPGGTRVQKPQNPFDRDTFKLVTSQQALEMLRRAITTAV